MRNLLAAALCTALCTTLGLAAPTALIAQEQEAQEQEAQQEGPGSRIVAVTTFQVPFTDRSKVFPYMMEYFLPGIQLNPNVIGFRVLLHNWGSDASQVVLVQEVEDLSLLEAECGQPCEDYYADHPDPEEGEEGYEEYREGLDLFNKYYAQHRDEIYTSPMGAAKVEGEMVGTVGPPPEEEQDEGS